MEILISFSDQLKMYNLSRVSGNTIFTWLIGKNLTDSSKQHKKRKEVDLRTNTEVNGRNIPP